MRVVNCGTCKTRIELNSEILASAATEVAVFVCGNCNARQEASYVKGRSSEARLWHATVEISKAVETPFYLEGSGQ